VLRDWLGEAKAKQVYLIPRDRILTGAIAFGAKLPTENELVEVHSVSRLTVCRALGELAREGLIERRSAGTRVELASPPLFDLIERAGVTRQRISAGLAAPDVAAALSARTGTPQIELTGRFYDQSGRGIDHLHALYRSDRYAFELDLVRSGTRDRSCRARQSRKAGDTASTTRRLITRSKPPDVRAPR
jgi:DNA-binding GntR family transcriptional regulator